MLKKEFDNLNSNLINPNFITGLIDAEGSFILKIGVRHQLEFTIVLHSIDKEIIELVYSYFKVGNYRIKGNRVIFSIVKLDLIRDYVLPHFDKYPLKTQKRGDYELFKKAVLIKINNKNYKEEELIAIKASMNRSLKGRLQSEYPDVIPVARPYYLNSLTIIDPYWLSGFVTGDGHFGAILKGNSIKLQFIITQHIRDKILLEKIIDYLDYGSLQRSRNTYNLVINKKEVIIKKIIPFFIKYPVKGSKYKDFIKFIELSKINLKCNPTKINQVLSIISSMNSNKY